MAAERARFAAAREEAREGILRLGQKLVQEEVVALVEEVAREEIDRHREARAFPARVLSQAASHIELAVPWLTPLGKPPAAVLPRKGLEQMLGAVQRAVVAAAPAAPAPSPADPGATMFGTVAKVPLVRQTGAAVRLPAGAALRPGVIQAALKFPRLPWGGNFELAALEVAFWRDLSAEPLPPLSMGGAAGHVTCLAVEVGRANPPAAASDRRPPEITKVRGGQDAAADGPSDGLGAKGEDPPAGKPAGEDAAEGEAVPPPAGRPAAAPPSHPWMALAGGTSQGGVLVWLLGRENEPVLLSRALCPAAASAAGGGGRGGGAGCPGVSRLAPRTETRSLPGAKMAGAAGPGLRARRSCVRGASGWRACSSWRMKEPRQRGEDEEWALVPRRPPREGARSRRRK